uniref:TRAM domain-containing protein n=1 Tax=Elaeophora elaphi TaxID=1147741 RepID=A0A0R3RNY1_9BILA
MFQRKPKQSLQELVSGTQKYRVMVPGPGYVDEEQELHASLLHQDDEGSVSDIKINSSGGKQVLDRATTKVFITTKVSGIFGFFKIKDRVIAMINESF